VPRQEHNTTASLRTRAPASFKRLLGRRTNDTPSSPSRTACPSRLDDLTDRQSVKEDSNQREHQRNRTFKVEDTSQAKNPQYEGGVTDPEKEESQP
jgi:hypothetical protein